MYRITFAQDIGPKMHMFKIEAPEIAKKAKPGQFIILMIGEKGERIPLSIADWDTREGTVMVVFAERGKTTEDLARLKTGDFIFSLVGPLGLPAEIESFGSVMGVAADYGVATIVPVARALKQVGNKVTLLIRAPDKTLLSQEARLREVSDELIISTDDGSVGEQDFIIDMLKELLPSRKVDRVFCIAPTCIMRYCCDVTKSAHIKTIVSLAPLMVDGTGMCGTCRVMVGGETKFACVDGPEFDGHEVDWNLLMTRRCRCSEQRQPGVRGFAF